MKQSKNILVAALIAALTIALVLVVIWARWSTYAASKDYQGVKHRSTLYTEAQAACEEEDWETARDKLQEVLSERWYDQEAKDLYLYCVMKIAVTALNDGNLDLAFETLSPYISTADQDAYDLYELYHYCWAIRDMNNGNAASALGQIQKIEGFSHQDEAFLKQYRLFSIRVKNKIRYENSSLAAEKEKTSSSSKSSGSKRSGSKSSRSGGNTYNRSDRYHIERSRNAEDFYCDNLDDFEDMDDAETYYREHTKS